MNIGVSHLITNLLGVNLDVTDLFLGGTCGKSIKHSVPQRHVLFVEGTLFGAPPKKRTPKCGTT